MEFLIGLVIGLIAGTTMANYIWTHEGKEARD